MAILYYKKSFLILTILLLTSIAKAQIVDSAPNGAQNYRPVEGGEQKVLIDTKTSIPDLIKRFEKYWDFVETGKGYWIGYTDDMYSIAAHSVYAIRPLINFIESTKNVHAKLGAVYTLHLIGINRKIVGRFSEKFTDKNARNALLYLLKYNDIGDDVMSLLSRDPWQSDVPKLIETIKKDTDCWYIINALQKYKLPDYPLNGNLPDKIANISFTIPYKAGFSTADFDIQFHQSLNAIRKLKTSNIHIDNDLIKMVKLWGNYKLGMNEASVKNNVIQLNIQDFLSTVTDNPYEMTGSRLSYYIKGNNLYMCAPKTSKNILLNWWHSQSDSYKLQFTLDHAKT